MNWNIIENIAELIITNGLAYADGRSDDFTVIEPIHGLTWIVDWLEINQNICSYKLNPIEIE